jgi:hypothetical protein
LHPLIVRDDLGGLVSCFLVAPWDLVVGSL